MNVGPLQDWASAAAIVESVATVIALCVAGLWTYRLFVKNRASYPRALVSIVHRLQPIAEQSRILRVEIQVKNDGAVLLPIGSLVCRLLQVRPVTGSLEERLRDGLPLILPNKQRVDWPMLDSRNWEYNKDQAEIEPGEVQHFCCDFSVDASVELAEIYCHLSNPRKNDTMGWTATAVVELPASGDVMASPPQREERQLPRQPAPERAPNTQVPRSPPPEPAKPPPKKG
jgi:hypothetical protein